MDRIRRLTLGQAAKIAALWPLALLGLAALAYAGFWTWLRVLEFRAGPTSSGDLAVAVTLTGRLWGWMVGPPALFLLMWAGLRLTKRAP